MKCNNCDNVFHISCAKLYSSGKFINESLFTCCELIDTDDPAWEDAAADFPKESGTDSTATFKYILRQKDELIDELRDKIKLLYTHIELLQKRESADCNTSKETLDGQGNLTDKKSAGLKVKKSKQTNSSQHHPNKENEPNKSGKGVPPTSDKPGDKKHNVRKGSSDVFKPESMEHSYNIENLPPQEEVGGDDWKQVTRRKSPRQCVIGNVEKSLNIKAIPKKAFLYVSRLHPSTKQNDVELFLKQVIPEAVCEQLESKFPQYYASFKVMVNLNNFNKAMDPNIWPIGAFVSRFFHPRTAKKTPT